MMAGLLTLAVPVHLPQQAVIVWERTHAAGVTSGPLRGALTLAGEGMRELEMDAAEYVVPAVLREAMFVPGQAAGRPGPARVTAGAFLAAGLPVPGHPAQRNVYQLTGRRGLDAGS
jgi:hypothetical protein